MVYTFSCRNEALEEGEEGEIQETPPELPPTSTNAAPYLPVGAHPHPGTAPRRGANPLMR